MAIPRLSPKPPITRYVQWWSPSATALNQRMLKPAAKTFWGGYDGYFADPDGNLWEVAFNPHWGLEEDGRIKLPD